MRVDALGRKGALTQFSKEMGKLAPEERARVGKLLNGAKQKLEDGARSAARQQFAEAALRARLDAEWVDLTLPAPGPRRGHLHPDHADPAGARRAVRLARVRGAGRSRGRDRVSQLRRAEYSAGPSGARHAGHVLAGRRQSAAHPHFAGAGARHGAAGAAAAHDRAGPRLPQRKRGRLARAHVLSARRHDDRPRRLGGAPALFHEDAADRDLPARGDRAAAAGLFPVRRAGLRAGYPVPDLRRPGLPGLQAERLGGTAAVRPGESECAAA